MVIKGNNGKAPARKRQSVAASSSSKSKRSNSVPKNPVSRDNSKAADELEGDIVCAESGALECATGDRVLELRISEDTQGEDLSSKPVELTAITLHQPWASLVAFGHKQYETRDWPTNHRGPIVIHAGRKPKGKQELREHDKVVASFKDLLNEDCPYSAVVAIAELTDVILMTEEFISQQCPTELRCGDWKIGRYAFKLENIRAIAPIPATGKQGLWKWPNDDAISSAEREAALKRLTEGNGVQILTQINRRLQSLKQLDNSHRWNPADFGELHHKVEADGQLNLLEWTDTEPPDPDDYEFREQFEEAYKEWAAAQTDEAEEELANFGVDELCNQLMDGSTFAVESVQDFPMLESNCGEGNQINSAKETVTAAISLNLDTLQKTEFLQTYTTSTATENQTLLQLPLPVNHLLKMENDTEPATQETVSQQSLQQSEAINQSLQLSKTLQDCSPVPTPPVTNQEVTSATSLMSFGRAGTMRNGSVSAAPTLPAPGVEKGSLLLRSPGALSTTTGRPPGKTRLETQLQKLGLISAEEVVAPEFLESGYHLPTGFTNPQENRSAMELAQAQQLAIVPSSESLQEMEATAIEEQPWAMPLTGESRQSDSSELTISVSLPPNIGALTKSELLSLAQEQHQLISLIERKQSELALEKLHRVYVTGICLMEFKKKCQYGEFVEQLEARGISARSAQCYMTVAKNWEVIEAKAKLVALLPEENQPNLGIKWAIKAIRDEKKQLKSVAPPKDPDSWRTPNTNDQPIVSLVKKALGGQIWLDPCSGSVTNNIPAAVRYFKDDDGLAQHQTWSKTVFINPPFSDPYPWVERCCLETARGSVSAAVMLLKAGVVSNVGTGELINKYASALCYWRGRIHFLNDEGNPVKGSDFDCVFVYFGARLDLFREAFGGRGTIATIENHYSSVNKKHLLKSEIPEFGNTQAEQKQLAAAVGLGNGRSVLPDMRDADRERNERYDPHTVVDVLSSSMPTASSKPVPVSENLAQPIGEVEIFDKTPLAVRQVEKAKENCLNDYITAVSGNITEFSDEQLKFLWENINKEVDRRNNQRKDPEFQQRLRQSLLDKLHS